MAKETRVTIKSVVASCLAEGKSLDETAAVLLAKYPGTKCAERPLYYAKYYANDLKTASTSSVGGRKVKESQYRIIDRTPLPNMKERLGEAVYGDGTVDQRFVFVLYRSMMTTIDRAERVLASDLGQTIKCYEVMTDSPAAWTLSWFAMRQAVLGDIQRRWYESAGKALPPEVELNQAERLEEARMSKKEAEGTEGKVKTPKEPRVTVKAVITAGLLAGKSDEVITKEVVAQFPDKVAAAKTSQHISYYRSFLVKSGQLEAQPRKARAKKEPAAAVAAPTPAKGAKKGK